MQSQTAGEFAVEPDADQPGRRAQRPRHLGRREEDPHANDFADDEGDVFAFGSASFMAVPDPTMRLPDDLSLDLPPPLQTLSVPLAERAGCRRVEPGVVVLERSPDGLNSSNTVNGGLIALAVEEAAVSQSPGHTLSVLDVRYLQPVRLGPVTAAARTRRGLCRVEVHDHGSQDRLAATATARLFA